MADKQNENIDNIDNIDRDKIAEAARNPEQAKKDGAHLFGAGMTTPDSTQVPYTSEGEPDYRAAEGNQNDNSGRDQNESGSGTLGRDESQR